MYQWQPSRLNSAPWQDPWNYRCRSASGGNTSPFTGTQNNSPSYVVGARTFGDVNGSTDTYRQIRVISTGIDWVAGVDEQVKDAGQVLPQGFGQDLFRPTYDIGGLGLDQFRFFGNPAFRRWNIFCHYDQNG